METSPSPASTITASYQESQQEKCWKLVPDRRRADGITKRRSRDDWRCYFFILFPFKREENRVKTSFHFFKNGHAKEKHWLWLSWRCASSPFLCIVTFGFDRNYTVFQQHIDGIWMKYFSLNFSYVGPAAGPTHAGSIDLQYLKCRRLVCRNSERSSGDHFPATFSSWVSRSSTTVRKVSTISHGEREIGPKTVDPIAAGDRPKRDKRSNNNNENGPKEKKRGGIAKWKRDGEKR